VRVGSTLIGERALGWEKDRLSQCIEFHITVIEQRKLHALGIHKEYGSVKGMTKSPAQGAKRKQKDT
jgi:hypothetical protein